MKRLVLIFSFVVCYTAANAQIKVLNNNRVIVGSNANTTNFDFDVFGDAYIRCLPSNSGIYFENYNNNAGGGGPFDEPILKGQWGNSVWLGNLNSPIWRIYSNRVYSTSASNYTYSDARLKSNVQPINNSLSNLMLLQPVRYDITMPVSQDIPENKREQIIESGKNQIGLIAQELKEVYPEAVDYDEENDIYAVSYGTLIPVLIKAIQEQQEEIEELKRLIK